MIRTVVCQKEGCCGNKFYIETIDNNLQATCMDCGCKYLFDMASYDCVMVSSCSECNNDTFKLFKDLDKETIYAKCSECGAPPEKIYIDSDGNQVSYDTKLLHDIKELMYKVDQRVCSLELKIEDMENGQNVLEESLAYINKYIIDKQ